MVGKEQADIKHGKGKSKGKGKDNGGRAPMEVDTGKAKGGGKGGGYGGYNNNNNYKGKGKGRDGGWGNGWGNGQWGNNGGKGQQKGKGKGFYSLDYEGGDHGGETYYGQEQYKQLGSLDRPEQAWEQETWESDQGQRMSIPVYSLIKTGRKSNKWQIRMNKLAGQRKEQNNEEKNAFGVLGEDEDESEDGKLRALPPGLEALQLCTGGSRAIAKANTERPKAQRKVPVK